MKHSLRAGATGSPVRLFCLSLIGMGCLATAMFLWGAGRGNGWRDWYLLWNLLLAWIPALLAYGLVRVLRTRLWSSWPALVLTLGWLLFLPNSFYIVSDYIHLADMSRGDVLFDALYFTVFVLNGLLLGYASLYLVELQIVKRIGWWRSQLIVAGLLLLCSFAIYLGRELRWNSWDVLVNPAGIIFDVSERVLAPFAHPQTFSVTAVFFVFLAGLYWVLTGLLSAIIQLAGSTRQR